MYVQVLILLAGLILVGEAARVPRTEEVKVEPEVVLPEQVEPDEVAKQVRHHVYMPMYRMPMPLMYRASNQAPVIQYVPVYSQDPRLVDPRFLSLGLGAHANLGGFASAGGNFGFDADQGTFNLGAGAGLGPNYANYGTQGVTSLNSATSTRTVPVMPYAPYVHATPKAVVYF